MLSLNEKAAHAITYFEALQANPNNTKQFAIEKLGYSESEAEEVVKVWCECFVEMTKKLEWLEIVELAQAPTTEEEKKRTLSNTKVRTKIQGIKATFQSDIEGTSYVHMEVTKPSKEVNKVLQKLEDVMTSKDWGYVCVELLEDEAATFYGDPEKTIKQMKDDYKVALKLALN